MNVASDADLVLSVSWLLAALHPNGPYPVLVLSGEKGTAKSTFARIMRALVDPNSVPLRSAQSDERDIFISLKNSHMIVFDNISQLSSETSDNFCRLSTGGGLRVRELYTNDKETLIHGCRPVIINGITNVVTRSDLSDRAITLTLEPIPKNKRRRERDLWEEVEKERPRILAALLDAMVLGLNRVEKIQLPESPRMADFAQWATACETALWPEGTFLDAYTENRSETVANVIENDLVASAVVDFMKDKDNWKGSATQLLTELGSSENVDEGFRNSKDWPSANNVLSKRLNLAVTDLRELGITVTRSRSRKAGRDLSIVRQKESKTVDDGAGDGGDGKILNLLAPGKGGIASPNSGTPFPSILQVERNFLV